MKMRMPQKLKTGWIKALRSGEYGQTKGRLTTGRGNFCCLGVLQHVASGGYCETAEYDPDRFRMMPSEEWYSKNNIEIGSIDGLATDSYLAYMNDGTAMKKHTFNQIADWIEKNVEGV